MTSRQPPSEPGHAALDDLTRLAAALSQNGCATVLTTSPPRLTISAPGLACAQHIHAGTAPHAEWFCWQDSCDPCPPAPFSPRSDPLPLTADRALNVLGVFTIAHQAFGPGPRHHHTPGQDPHQQDTP
jgi:hypothetical protein